MWCAAWVVGAWCCVAVAAGGCDVTVGDHTYKEEVLVTDVRLIRGLAVDFSTQVLYYNYFNPNWFNAQVDLASKEVTVIKQFVGRCWFTADQVHGRVYAGCGTERGGSGGLYQRNGDTGPFEEIGEQGQEVQFVYYDDDSLFYSLLPEAFLRTYTSGQSALVSPPVKVLGLVINGDADRVFQNWTGVYRQTADGASETRYKEYGGGIFALAVDGRGDVYSCDYVSPKGIWRLEPHAPTATKLLDVSCCGLTFDSDDNIIYADCIRQSIIRLVKC